MPRTHRHAVLSIVPRRLKPILRSWYEGLKPRPKLTRLLLEDDAHGMTAKVGTDIAMKVSPELCSDLTTHFLAAEHAGEMTAFLDQAKQPGILFDLGANNGFFSLLYCLSHPANHAVGYEPSPFFCERMRRLVTMNAMSQRVTVVDKAIGESEITTEMLLDEQGGFVQIAGYPGSNQAAMKKVLLHTTTLDAEWRRHGKTPTLIKIDIEGYEWEALKGAKQLLSTVRPVILLELHLNYLEFRGIRPGAITSLLAECGYAFYSLEGELLSARSVTASWSPVVRILARSRP